MLETNNFEIVEVCLWHEAQYWNAFPCRCWKPPFFDLIDRLEPFDKDLATLECSPLGSHGESASCTGTLLHIANLDTYDNHHRLFEHSESLDCIEDPCCCFLQLDIMTGVMILEDHSDGRLLISWKDVLEVFLCQFWNFPAHRAMFLMGFLWIWDTKELRFELLMEWKVPIDFSR